MKESDEQVLDAKELSEKELLLLSNYMYLDCSTIQGSIDEMLSLYKTGTDDFDMEKIREIKASGGIRPEDIYELFKMMNDENDEFKQLRVEKCIDRGGIRGSCFVSVGENNEKDATVVFRGTGGTYAAWSDNLFGEYQSDTVMQRLAADFINNDCAEYEDITVSGHSKGGNLAQYVTVECLDKVDRCVSYDGQGFGEAFREENTEKINTTKDRIKSISAHNDFVNILLTPIAGERIFVENKADGVNAHSSFFLLKDNEYDENGMFKTITTQDKSIGKLESAINDFVKLIDKLPGDGNVMISNMMAAFVAAIMSDDRSTLYEIGMISDRHKKLNDYFDSFLPSVHTSQNEITPIRIYDTDLSYKDVYEGIESMEEMIYKLESSARKVDGIRRNMNDGVSSRLLTNNILRRLVSKLEDNANNLSTYKTTAEDIMRIYKNREDNVKNIITAVRT